MSRLRTLLADDHTLVRAGLRKLGWLERVAVITFVVVTVALVLVPLLLGIVDFSRYLGVSHTVSRAAQPPPSCMSTTWIEWPATIGRPDVNFIIPSRTVTDPGAVAPRALAKLKVAASIYLLMALGLKGGFALAASGLTPSVASRVSAMKLSACVVTDTRRNRGVSTLRPSSRMSTTATAALPCSTAPRKKARP